MELHVLQGDIAQTAADCVVVNLFEGVTQPGGATGALDSALDGAISSLIGTGDFTGEAGTTALLYTYGKVPAPREGYYEWLATTYQAKRDKLMGALEDVGLVPVRPDGSYFIIVATGHLDVPVPPGTRRDVAVARWFTTDVGVTAIPPSPFYSPEHQDLTDNLARFCFCKTDEMLDEAARRLRSKLG